MLQMGRRNRSIARLLAVFHRWATWLLILSCSPEGRSLAAMQGAALQKFNRGLEALHAKRFADALRHFQASMQIEPSPNTRFQMARCYEGMGLIGSAYDEFRRSAQEAQDRLNATHERRYAATQQEALVHVARLDPLAPRITLVLPAEAPAEFVLTLDGDKLDRAVCGEALVVDPGDHEIRAGGPRLVPFTARMHLQQGQRQRLTLDLKHQPQAELQLELRTKPAGLAVQLDDKPLPPGRFDELHIVDVGRHRVTVSAPGYASFRWERELSNGERHRVPVVLHPTSGAPRWVFYAVAGSALCTLAVGAGISARASLDSSAEASLPIPERSIQRRDELRSLSMGANIAYGIGAALSATALVVGLTTRWRAPEEPRALRLSLLPLVAPRNAGLSVSLSKEF